MNIINKLFNLEYDKPQRVKFKADGEDTCSLVFHLILVALGFLNFVFIAVPGMGFPLGFVMSVLFGYSFIQQMRSFITCMRMDPGYVKVDVERQSHSIPAAKITQNNTMNAIQDNNELKNVVIQEAVVAPVPVFNQTQDSIQTEQNQSDTVNQTIQEVVQTVQEPKDTLETIPLQPQINQQNQTKKKAENEEDNDQTTTFCTYCNQIKPPRAHHCKTCNKCVERYDHHCPFVANCIGQDNYKYFFKFCIYASASSAISLICTGASLFSENFMKFYGIPPENAFMLVWFMFPICFSLIGVMMPSMIACGNCDSVCEGETIIEKKKGEKQKQTCKQNCRDFLGANWGWFLLRMKR
ncbi:Palmitoyltransferase [Hexamita inflata]|uniref:Palmitoyltransferase n=1 Tax=Hexamita inflata TaxID=28002 RepID=A0AA86P4I9_9EUKA|nr:Palmitoyltransferase [Hexamita inflata]